ncbi:MAG TPA: GyrI-like domain-containing protein [Clostridiaceae bacterium]
MLTDKLDYKKVYKNLYLPKCEPNLIDVPSMNFIMVEGKGNPNAEGGEYQLAVELLYGLSYTIKMSKMGKFIPTGYFEYVVPPLEGLWWMSDNTMDFSVKDKYCWISMIRQPEFVTDEVFQWACCEVIKKKPLLDVSKAKLETFREGLCVQMMHIGPYSDEPKTITMIESYIQSNNLKEGSSSVLANGTINHHHEIYLSDPRKTDPIKMKTVLRHPVEYK